MLSLGENFLLMSSYIALWSEDIILLSKNCCRQSSLIASPPPFSCSGHFLHHHRILLNLKSFSCPSFITLPYYNIIINKKNITTINNCKKWIIELGKHFKHYHNFLGPPGKQFGSTAIATIASITWLMKKLDKGRSSNAWSAMPMHFVRR